MTTLHRCFRSLTWLLPLLVTAFTLAMPALAQGGFQIQAVANPTRLVFGEDNNVTIDVSVMDGAGRTVPDGTIVKFSTSLGSVPALAYTQRGQVKVLLENQVGPGRAVITVSVETSRQVLTVEYVGSGSSVSAPDSDRVSYRVKGKQVYFSADQRVFDVRDKAQFIAQRYTVTADALQYDVRSNMITAQGNVTVTAGKESIPAEKLNLALLRNSATLVQVDPDIKFFRLNLLDMKLVEDVGVQDIRFTPLNPLPTKTWIICRDAVIYPGDMVQFRQPKFYLDNFDRLLYALPNHVIDLRTSGEGTFFNTDISLTSDAGLNVDFPVYYLATGSQLGSVHFRNVSRGSNFYKGESGVQVGLEHEYLMGKNGDGGIYLDDATRETRGLSWDHRQKIGKTRFNLNASYDRYSAETPYTTRLGFAASHSFGNSSLNMNTNWSAFKEDRDLFFDASFNPPAIPLGRSGMSFNISPSFGFSQSKYTLERDRMAETKNSYEGLRFGLGFPTINLLGGTLSLSASDQVTHETGDIYSNYFDAGVSYRHPLGRAFSTSLSYSYGLPWTSAQLTQSPAGQRLSFDLSGSSARSWNMYSYASYDLNSSSLYSSANLSLFLPWFKAKNGMPLYSLLYRASYSDGNSFTSSDHLFSLGRDVGAYTIFVHYSPSGNTGVTGIGSGTGKKWAVELVRKGW